MFQVWSLWGRLWGLRLPVGELFEETAGVRIGAEEAAGKEIKEEKDTRNSKLGKRDVYGCRHAGGVVVRRASVYRILRAVQLSGPNMGARCLLIVGDALEDLAS